jgi:plastocyanin
LVDAALHRPNRGAVALPSRRGFLRLGAAGLALAPVVLLSGCGIRGPAYQNVAAGGAAVVVMTNTFDFAPSELEIRVGDTVDWRNRSLFTHTVTADPSLARNPDHAVVPDGAATFHSGDIRPGKIFSHTFTVPGTYLYFCVPHERLSMTGSVRVIA